MNHTSIKHAFFLVINAKKRSATDNFFTVHIFSRSPNDLEFIDWLKRYLLRHLKQSGGRSDLAKSQFSTRGLVMDESQFGI